MVSILELSQSKYQGLVTEVMAHIDLGSSITCEDAAAEHSTRNRPLSPKTLKKTRLRHDSSYSASSAQSSCKSDHVTKSVYSP